MTQGKINYGYPLFVDHVIPRGHLPIDKRAHALFRYYQLCQKLLEKAGFSTDDQIIYDDAPWMDKPYGNIAKGVAVQYGLADPGEFLKPGFKQMVEAEIRRLGWPAPNSEYWNPQPNKVITV